MSELVEGIEHLAEDLDLGPILGLQELTGGLGSPPLRISFENRVIVVKRFGDDRPAAKREYANLLSARLADVPTPEPLGLDLDGTWLGCAAIAMGYLDGSPLFPALPEPAWVDGLAAALVSVHHAPVPAGEPQMPRRLIGALEAAAADDLLLRRITNAFQPIASGAPGADVVWSHGDYHPGNVLFHRDGVTGVVDWLDGGPRHRASDVAYCRSVLAVVPGGDAPELFLDAYESKLGRHIDSSRWDALWAARGIFGAHRRWPEALQALNVSMAPGLIEERSREWADAALHGLRA